MPTKELEGAIGHLLSLQQLCGCWEGEMAWCTMILSQYVIVQHLAGHVWTEHERRQIIRHYESTRRADGSWGLHPESAGYVFTTTLAYVALRLLGLSPDHELTGAARSWLHAQPGGVLSNPTWGKFWLALVDLYGYEGVHPLLPELFLLPAWLPFHPWNYYCHTRYIYLGMAYLFGCKFKGLLPIRDALREELYGLPFEQINFALHRSAVAASDLYVRPAAVLRLAYRMFSYYDHCRLAGIRRKALDFCFERILYEQRASLYQGLSPVNALLNCLAILARDPAHPDLRPSLAGLEAWKWEDEREGRRYAGARSQTWDTAFAIQALMAGPTIDGRIEAAVRRGYRFLRKAQLTEELPGIDKEHRSAVRGGWCFSDGMHRWAVSDCTAEALSAVLACQADARLALPRDERFPSQRLYEAIEFVLSRQNTDGGFGTYERRRGPLFLERMNPAEMYGSCMTERSYLECTGSALAAMAHFRNAIPGVYSRRIERAMQRAIEFLLREQRPDGAWPGFWGVHFTYAIFHVVRGLRAAGLPHDHPSLQRAAEWLIRVQHADGGWGEHFSGCLHDTFADRSESQAVQTSWACLALLEILPVDAEPTMRGIAWLQSRQQPDGSWIQAGVTGVFFGTAMLDYRLYASYFPAWALARWQTLAHSQSGKKTGH
jgi:2,3-oxidosqualene cyclase